MKFITYQFSCCGSLRAAN